MEHLLLTYLIFGTILSAGWAYLLDNRCGMTIYTSCKGCGEDADVMSMPWMVFLHSNNKFICGGSLINSWFILTAAHCFAGKHRNEDIWARLGEHNSESKPDCTYWDCAPNAREYLIVNKIKHPNFRTARYHDIALGRLNRQVKYTDTIRPICVVLGKSGGWQSYLNSRRTLSVSGWGTTRFFHTAELEQIDRHSCRYTYGYNVEHSHICAGNTFQYAVKGDSGSPLGLMVDYNDDSRFIQFGIVSHNPQPFLGVTVFTNVLTYANWISRVINSYNYK